MKPLLDPSAAAHAGDAAPLDLRSIGAFFRQWMRDPVKMASVTPSGQQLAHLMVAGLPDGAARIAELGAGTGVFTRALLDAGIAASQLLVVEINPRLADFLRERFPTVAIACADARRVDVLAGERGFLADGRRLDAVVSGLGMLSMSSALRVQIVEAAFRALGPDGRFVQFTYGLVSPVRRSERDALGIRVRRTGFALRNLPPANVFVYQRMHSHQIPAIRRNGLSRVEARPPD